MSDAEMTEESAGAEGAVETTEADAPAVEESSAPAETSAEPGADAAPKMTTKERKADRHRFMRENEELKATLSEQRSMYQKLIDEMGGMRKAVESTLPKPESPHEKAKKEFRARAVEAFRGLDNNDPKAFEKFLDILEEAGRIGSMPLLDERFSQFKGEIPQPKPPMVARLEAKFAWLEDADPRSDTLKQAVNTYADRLVATKYRGRDVKGNPDLLFAVLNEAASMVARDWELPVEADRDPNSSARVAGMPGRNLGGGGSGGTVGGLDAETLREVDAAAQVIFPQANMTPAQKREAFLQRMRKNQPDVYKQIVGG